VFVSFLGMLRSKLLAAEGGDGKLATITFASGITAATCLMLQPGPDLSAVLAEDDIDASSARAIHAIGDVFYVGAEYFLPVLLVAFAIPALRTGDGDFPAWFAWISVGIAIVLLVAPIGWAALVFAFPIWVLVLSFMLWARSGTTTTAAGPWRTDGRDLRAAAVLYFFAGLMSPDMRILPPASLSFHVPLPFSVAW
jgi:hypothetical protein